MTLDPTEPLQAEPISNRMAIEPLLRVHYELQKGAFISEWSEEAGWIRVSSRISPAPMWNHLARLDGVLGRWPDALDQLQKHLHPERAPVLYVVDPEGGPDLLPEELVKCDQEVWMSFDLTHGGANESRSELEIRPVTTAAEAAEFTRVFRAAYQAMGAGYASLFQAESERTPNTPALRHYLAYSGGTAVCIATLMWREARACIYNVGTLPQARKRGFAEDLVRRIIADCRAFGHQLVFLQAEKGSGAERLYSRLGFRTVFTRSGYRLRAPAAARPGERAGGEGAAAPPGCLKWIHREQPVAPSTERQALISVPWPTELNERLNDWTAHEGIAKANVWVAAWALLLRRYSGHANVAFGLLDASGADRGTTPTRRLDLEVDEQIRARDWVRRVADAVSLSFAKAMEPAAAVEGDGALESTLHFGDRAGAILSSPARSAIECHVPPGSGVIDVRYDAHLFKPERVTALAGHWVTLVRNMLEHAGEALESLEILPEPERLRLVVEWNRPPGPLPAYRSVTRLIEARAAADPARSAVLLASPSTLEGTPRCLTYGQLNADANRLARCLQRSKVGPEDVVGIYLDRSPELLVALLAVLKAGGVVLPLDPSYPEERLQFMVSDARARLLISRRSVPALPGTELPTLLLDRDAARIAAEPHNDLATDNRAEAGAYIIYTSGSTGKPKGVLVEHRALSWHCQDARELYGLTADDQVLQFNAISFDAAFEQIFSSLISGAGLVMRGPEVWTTREFADQLAAHRVTVADLPTAYWRQLLVEWTTDQGTRPIHLPRLFIAGGEAMSPESLRLWLDLPAASALLVNAYGPTETTITATAFVIRKENLTEPLPPRVSIGRPRGGRTAYILDQLGRLTPEGVPGELYLGGPLLARGYVNRADITREKFIPDPFSADPDARLYRTGDLVRYRPDGNIEFLGRVDEQVKIRGFRVEPGEVENVLLQHPKVGHAAVLVQDGGAHPVLAGYVTPRNGALPSPRELREFLRQSLPDYMVPTRLVTLPRFPMLPGGKIDRRTLAATPADPSEEVIAGPRTPLELRLQLLFERILRRNNVGIDVSFFEIGGDSLQALELIVEIERMSGQSLPLETLYQASSVEGLARLLEQGTERATGGALAPLQTGGSRPPLFLVHTTPGDILGYGNLIYHLDTNQPCYGLQSLGLICPEARHHTIEEMASYYVGLVRATQPNGPYYLAGWCYGGIVAVEMAQQLSASGGQVAFLGLLETVAAAPSLRVYRYYLHRLRCFFGMRPRHWSRYFRSKLRYYREARLADKMRFRRLERTELNAAAVEEQNRRLAQLEQVYRTNLNALKFYKARPYGGKVTLFNAEQVDPGVMPDPLYAWPGLARDIEVHTVPGDHDTMLTEPNVAVLAKTLDACLRRAQCVEENPAWAKGSALEALAPAAQL